jgi:general secretion pathway protein D
VEAVIMEVDVSRLRQLGSDPVQVIGALKKGALAGIAGFNRAPEAIQEIAQLLTGTTTGGVNVVNSVNVRLFLQLLLTMTDTNLISTPQLLASDNQKAKIVVGQNVPVPTGQAQGITGGTLVTIERKDVGVTLELTPQVLDNGLVRLELKEEVTSIVPGSQVIGTSANTSVPVGPTFTKRSMETVTVAHDEQTIVVGGLVQDDIQVTENKIPLLGDIPGIGWLFKSQSTQVTKQNLLVFLTPHLVKDEADMVKLNERKGQEMDQSQNFSNIMDPTAVKRATDALLPGALEPPSPPPAELESK